MWLVFAASPSLPGEQYVDQGYAVSVHDVVAYHNLDQSDAGAAQPEAVKDSPELHTEFNLAK